MKVIILNIIKVMFSFLLYFPHGIWTNMFFFNEIKLNSNIFFSIFRLINLAKFWTVFMDSGKKSYILDQDLVWLTQLKVSIF